MSRLAIVGTGGHAKVVADAAIMSGFSLVGWIDNNRDKGELINAIQVIGSVLSIKTVLSVWKIDQIIVAIGDNYQRSLMIESIINSVNNIQFATIIHPSAIISTTANIGQGSVVSANSVVQPNCHVGPHSIVNTSATIDHDTICGCFTSVGPGCHCGGNVVIGDYSAIGIGASISHGIHVGKNSVIGAGSVVIRNIPDHVVAYGVPARILRERKIGEKYL